MSPRVRCCATVTVCEMERSTDNDVEWAWKEQRQWGTYSLQQCGPRRQPASQLCGLRQPARLSHPRPKQKISETNAASGDNTVISDIVFSDTVSPGVTAIQQLTVNTVTAAVTSALNASIRTIVGLLKEDTER